MKIILWAVLIIFLIGLLVVTGARSAQGAANRRRPCTPGLWRTKSPLRGALGLSLTATGSGAR